MSKKDNLAYALNSNQSAVKRLIQDITDEESLVRGQDNLQHIRWQTGHLVYNAHLVLKSLGGEGSIPETWYQMFKRGCDWSEDPGVYPSMAELKKKLYALYEQGRERLEDMSNEELDEEFFKEIGFDTSAMNMVLFFCTHEFYHAGQIAVLRRILGRERLFG